MKKILVLFLCIFMLAGCGADEKTNDAGESTEADGSVYEGADADDAEYDEFEEDGEEDEETVEDDGMMDYTVYTGDVVSVAYDGLTRVALDAEQVIPVDTMEFVYSENVSFCVPAASISDSIKNYDTLLANGDVECDEAERYTDYILDIYIDFPNEDRYVKFFLDNETNADDVDEYTLPVTQIMYFFDGPVTINGFAFSNNTFSIQDLVAAWGNPLMVRVDTREGVVADEEYFWRYQDGFVELSIEEGKLFSFKVYQWDTCTADDYYFTEEIPRVTE